MNRIKINTKQLINKLFNENRGKFSVDEIILKLYEFKQNTLAFYSRCDETIYINGKELKRYYSNEHELVNLLVRILSHEYYHYILHKQEGNITCQVFDNDWLGEILEDYGIMSKRETIKLYALHHTFIY